MTHRLASTLPGAARNRARATQSSTSMTPQFSRRHKSIHRNNVVSAAVNACHLSVVATRQDASSSPARPLSRVSAAVYQKRRLFLGALNPAVILTAGGARLAGVVRPVALLS